MALSKNRAEFLASFEFDARINIRSGVLDPYEVQLTVNQENLSAAKCVLMCWYRRPSLAGLSQHSLVPPDLIFLDLQDTSVGVSFCSKNADLIAYSRYR